jgi:hypothetical protein
MGVRHGHAGGHGVTRSVVAAWLFAVVTGLVLAGCGGLQGSSEPAARAPGESAATAPADRASAIPVAPAGQAEKDAADPVRVRVPAVDIDAPVNPLFVDGNGVLPPPESFDAAGWWHDGPEPGEAGPAVITGHVDSYRGPAVFFRLDDITAGDRIFVDRADGSTVTFVAHRTERHPKDGFPTEAVYGDTPETALRLITCGGVFDEEDRRYLDNIIVFATRAD